MLIALMGDARCTVVAVVPMPDKTRAVTTPVTLQFTP